MGSSLLAFDRYLDLKDHPKEAGLKTHPLRPFVPSTPPIQGSSPRSGCFLGSGTMYSNLRYRLMYSNLESHAGHPLRSHLRGWALYWNLGIWLLALRPCRSCPSRLRPPRPPRPLREAPPNLHLVIPPAWAGSLRRHTSLITLCTNCPPAHYENSISSQMSTGPGWLLRIRGLGGRHRRRLLVATIDHKT